MKNSDLFTDSNIDLFMPDGVEYIYNVLQNIGWDEYTSVEAREEGLQVLSRLFEMDLIEVFSFGNYQKKLKNRRLSNNEIINHLRKVWFVGADFNDFLGMPMFKYKDWYLNALKEEGFSDKTDWRRFVDECIGDLEQWIKEQSS